MKSFLKGKRDKKSDGEASKTLAIPAMQHGSSSTGPQNPSGGPEFSIQRVYLKSLNYEAPSSPGIFQQEWKHTIDMQIKTNTTKLSEGLHEAVIEVTVIAKSDEKPVFKVEVQQAGIFVANRFTDEQLGAVLGGMCPNILFPYAREAITELATRGTFPPIYLAPINFDVVYAQAVEKQAREDQK